MAQKKINTIDQSRAFLSESTLKDFLKEQIRELYWTEKYVSQTLPTMLRAASSDGLKLAFASNREATDEHVVRLEQVFRILGDTPRLKKCDAAETIIKEAETAMDDFEDGVMQDVALIIAAQKLQHYKIAAYNGVLWMAGTLGLNEIADLFETILSEEDEADQTLTSVAQSQINFDAEEDE